MAETLDRCQTSRNKSGKPAKLIDLGAQLASETATRESTERGAGGELQRRSVVRQRYQ